MDQTNVDLKKSAQRYNFITPRDFLDFINHFIGGVLRCLLSAQSQPQISKPCFSGGVPRIDD